MKKILSLALALSLAFAMTACGDKTPKTDETPATTQDSTNETTPADTTPADTTNDAAADVETQWSKYMATAEGEEVVVEFYVQNTQSWWNNAITVYGADKDGGYFVYNMECSQEDAAKLVPGTKIKVTGTKTSWAGEIEISGTEGDPAVFEFVDGDSYVAPAVDVTDLIGTDALEAKQNMLVSFSDMTVTAVSYKNGEPGDDIYVNAEKNGTEVAFCLEYYLNGSDEDLYSLVGNLAVGTVVDIEGYLYWYEGANPHITKVTVK